MQAVHNEQQGIKEKECIRCKQCMQCSCFIFLIGESETAKKAQKNKWKMLFNS